MTSLTGARTDKEKFLQTARDRFQLVNEAEAEMRVKMLDALNFYNGEQWPADVLASRKDANRPCLTFNRTKGFVHQISNDIRQQKPSPNVRPVDDNSDVDTADAIKGLIRHTENISKADAVRGYAGIHQVICGRGWYRVTTEYCYDDVEGDPLAAFDLEVFIRRIKNQASVYADPMAQEPDYSDMKWCFVIEDVLKTDFVTEHPNATAASIDYASVGDNGKYWAGKDTIRVAEYFYIEPHKQEMALVIRPEDGMPIVMPLSEVPKGVEIHKKRTVTQQKVKWAKITATDILEEKDWEGKWIPIIPYLGEELYINGKTHLNGIVADMADAQRQYNYMRTMQTETIALAPRAPWVIAHGQLEGFEKFWESANTKNWSHLPYNAIDVNGNLAPPPQRQQFEPAIQATTVAVREAAEDLKGTTGIYDASLGNRSNENSGIAIKQRQIEGDTANFHFADAVGVGINHESRILIDLYPKIYDRPGRIMRILGEDGSEKKGLIGDGNQPPPEEQQQLPSGIAGIYNLGAGKFDVATDIGPSFQTRRKEAADSMLRFAQAAPNLLPRFADLMAKAQDWPYAAEIAKRLVPPDVAKEEQEGKPDPQQLMMQLQQLGAMYDEVIAAFEETNKTLESKALEISSKERIEMQKAQNTREEFILQYQLEMAKLGSQESQFELQHRLAAVQAQQDADQYELDQMQAQAQQQRDLEHQQWQAEEARKYEAEQAEQARMHEQQQAEAGRMHQSQESEAGRIHQSQEAQAQREAMPPAMPEAA